MDARGYVTTGGGGRDTRPPARTTRCHSFFSSVPSRTFYHTRKRMSRAFSPPVVYIMHIIRRILPNTLPYPSPGARFPLAEARISPVSIARPPPPHSLSYRHHITTCNTFLFFLFLSPVFFLFALYWVAGLGFSPGSVIPSWTLLRLPEIYIPLLLLQLSPYP